MAPAQRAHTTSKAGLFLVPRTTAGLAVFFLLFNEVICHFFPVWLMRECVQCRVSRRHHPMGGISYRVAVTVTLLMGITHLNFPTAMAHGGHWEDAKTHERMSIMYNMVMVVYNTPYFWRQMQRGWDIFFSQKVKPCELKSELISWFYFLCNAHIHQSI